MKQQEPTSSVRQLMKRALNAMSKADGGTAFNLLNQVLQINPNHVEALFNVGYILQSIGRYEEAQQYYELLLRVDPTYIDTYMMLTKLLEDRHMGEQAIKIAQLATQMAPDNPKTHIELASLLNRFNQSHQAMQYLAQVVPKFPKDAALLHLYCMTLKINERHEEADIAYDKLINDVRTDFAARFIYETYLPRLYRSTGEIDRTRTKFKASLENFIAHKQKIQIDQIKYQPIFQLAFHNRDNKELLQLFTKALRSMAPKLNYIAPHCKLGVARKEGKIRVGFISNNMHNHSVGICYRGVMIALAQNTDFEVTFFNISNVVDSGLQQIVDAGVPVVSLGKSVLICHEAITPYKLDIIIYPDIGMDAMTSYLAMGRMATYQLCFQGHPETTGIDTVDYFIGSRTYEPPHADENYTERLLCTDGIDTVFKVPTAPAQWLTRADFKLPEDKKLYVCPMAIQKFHPDFDDVLANILAADPDAVLVLFNDFQQVTASTLLQERILKKCARDRVIFMQWLPLEFLFSLMKLADAILDTIYFGGGTTVQFAFYFGMPVVTMPGTHARGRFTYSFYSIMGVPNAPIANNLEEYVAMAVKLANDKDYHRKVSEELLARNSVMFAQSDFKSGVAQLLHDIMDQKLDGYQR